MAGDWSFKVDVLGCKVNQYESEQIRALLLEGGGREVETDADLLVLHSCAVTAAAVRKLRQLLRKLRDNSPRARIIVSGCGAAAGIVDADLPDFIYVEPGPGWLGRLSEALQREGFPVPARAEFAGDALALDHFSGHHRAFLKIQDGCDIHCSYCIVPSLRGPSRDKPLDDVLREAERLVAGGHREIVLTGVSIGLYGRRSGVRLAQVLERVARLPGVERLRLSSLHPSELDEEMLAVWRANPNIMPHIHLPLQSGSDSVLRAMGRGYDRADFMRAVARAQSALDRPAITTDIIVGFPGESAADFEDTLDLCRQVCFSRMHIFPYSPRPGTGAESIAARMPAAEIKRRMKLLRELSTTLRDDFYRGLIGMETRVLAERCDSADGMLQGYSERYAPVAVPGREALVGQILPVRISALKQGVLTGVRIGACG
jgi:threonylcarbamoyladenosine tRNA methylthiotransferase MtaB